MAIQPGETIVDPVKQNPTLPIGSCIEAKFDSFSMTFYKVGPNNWFCVEHRTWFANGDFAANKNTLRNIEIEDVPVGSIIGNWTKAAPGVWCATDHTITNETDIMGRFPDIYQKLSLSHNHNHNHTTTEEPPMGNDYNKLNQEEAEKGAFTRAGTQIKDNVVQGFHIGWSTAVTKKVVDLLAIKLKEKWPENAAMLDDPVVRKLMESILPMIVMLILNSEYRDKVPANNVLEAWAQNATVGLAAEGTQELITFAVDTAMPMVSDIVDVIKGEATKWEDLTGEKMIPEKAIDFEEAERQAKADMDRQESPVEREVQRVVEPYRTVGDS